MLNRPYVANAANVFNESTQQTAPATFQGNNLLISYDQNRSIVDNTVTSVTNQNPLHPTSMMQQNPNMCPWQQLQAQRHLTPEGVTYTFMPEVQNYALKNFRDVTIPQETHHQCNPYSQPPLDLHQQIALNELQRNALENMLLHEKLRQNPFKLQFHKDGQTDTDDIPMTCSCHTERRLPPTHLTKSFEETMDDSTYKIDFNGQHRLKPIALMPDCDKNRRLQLSKDGVHINKNHKQFEEKYVQFEQPMVSVEIQCKLNGEVQEKQVSNAEEEKVAPGSQTKKVTFTEENDTSPKTLKAKIAKKFKRKSTTLVSDDISSDESTGTSATSETD